MTLRAAAVPVALAAVLVSGCGTVSNVFSSTVLSECPGPGQFEPYGGVKEDLDRVRTLKAPDWSAHDRRELAAALNALGTVLFVALDLPLSAIGDTLTLPLALGPPPSPPWFDQPRFSGPAVGTDAPGKEIPTTK
jgi:uncharacterized protein YceK